MKKIVNCTAQPRTIMLERGVSLFLESFGSASAPDDYQNSEHARNAINEGVIREIEELPTQQVPPGNTGSDNKKKKENL